MYRALVGSPYIEHIIPKPHLVILSAVPTKFGSYTLAVETAGYLYKVPLRALHLSGNNFVGSVLSVAKDQPPTLDSPY